MYISGRKQRRAFMQCLKFDRLVQCIMGAVIAARSGLEVPEDAPSKEEIATNIIGLVSSGGSDALDGFIIDGIAEQSYGMDKAAQEETMAARKVVAEAREISA